MPDLSIDRIANGWLATIKTGDGKQTLSFSYPLDGEEKEEREQFVHLLYEILDTFLPNSKHNEYRIDIKLVKQKTF